MQVVLLGAGKLARHLGPALVQRGMNIVAVYNRSLVAAKGLAAQLGVATLATDDWAQLPKNADLYLLAVADQAIGPVAQQLSAQLGPDVPMAHTSGATPITVLAPFTSRFGGLYPLQSFSNHRPIDFAQIPFCVQASDPTLLNLLRAMAQKMSPQVYELDDAQRAQLHLAAVFANNFVNYLIGQSQQILAQAAIPRTILFNLIRETIEKLEVQDAASAQTGPAIRGDQATIEKHLQLLAANPAARAVYQLISEQIAQTHS